MIRQQVHRKDTAMNRNDLENDIFNSLQRMRTIDSLFGINTGNGFIEDMIADNQLSGDIANGVDVRDALADQRFMDSLFGEDRSNGIIEDMIDDSMIASNYENGCDLGEAIAEQRFWDDLL